MSLRLQGVAAVVLAAGHSSRMGGTPKGLVTWGGQPAALHLADLLAGCSPRLLVIRAGADWPTPAIRQAWELVVNPDAERGMLSSVQCALATLAPLGRSTLLLPVDCLGVEPATIAALLAAPGVVAGGSARPVCQGRPGHPVLLGPAAQRLVLSAEPTATSLRQLLDQLRPAPQSVPVDDEAILRNINTPAELAGAGGGGFER